ncbi:MAG: thiamine pyrophosphate-binding protein [Stellaceae bacterium]
MQEWGIKRVYGCPGDGVGGLDVALENARDGLQYIQVRHEEMAAFMTSGHAKFTSAPARSLMLPRKIQEPSRFQLSPCFDWLSQPESNRRPLQCHTREGV